MLFKNQTDISRDYVGAYVYKPEYLVSNKQRLIINKIPSINKQDLELVKCLNNVFGYTKSSSDIKEKFIYFDQPYPFESINEQTKYLLRLLQDYIPDNELIIKLHPRTKKGKYDDIKSDIRIYDSKAPLELLILNNNFEDKVLISVYSTACLSPKMMFDEEPYVIFLFNLIDLSLMTCNNSETYKLAYKVRESYRTKNRFFIPEKIEELEEILNMINGNRH